MAPKKRKTLKNTYIIRKAVVASNMSEALTKEKRAPILDIILASSDGNQYIPAIGFQPAMNTEDDDR